MYKVNLSNNKQFDFTDQSNLLDAAKEQGIILEYSCRNGRCGTCKSKLLKGNTGVVCPEEALSEEEQKEGYILTCCRTATSDIELDAKEIELLNNVEAKIFPCRINEIKKLSDDVIQITLRLPADTPLNYVAGQYIDVIKADGTRRSYSLANAPRVDDKLELQIRMVKEGVMSGYWFNTAKQNDLLRLEGPLGTFCYRKTAKTNLVFMATGTGIAPIKAILEELESNLELTSDKVIYIFWGGRKEQDLYWKPEFKKLNLHFVPVLSRPESNWTGKTGYIQQAVLDESIELGNSVVYACGSDVMINAARNTLCSSGLEKEHFYSDAFVSSC